MISSAPEMSFMEREPRVYGVANGVVTNNKDPLGMGRVKVKFPWLSDQDESNWARVATPMGGKERGLYLLPEVDDEVLVAFEHGSVERPCVIGSLWNGKDKPPTTNDDGKNDIRMLKSRSGHIIRLTDKDGEETIEIIDKSAKNSIVIATKDNTIKISADADISITSNNGKIVLSAKGVEIESKADVKVKANAGLNLEASGNTVLKGATVAIN